jgi:hypothetical protein
MLKSPDCFYPKAVIDYRDGGAAAKSFDGIRVILGMPEETDKARKDINRSLNISMSRQRPGKQASLPEEFDRPLTTENSQLIHTGARAGPSSIVACWLDLLVNQKRIPEKIADSWEKSIAVLSKNIEAIKPRDWELINQGRLAARFATPAAFAAALRALVQGSRRREAMTGRVEITADDCVGIMQLESQIVADERVNVVVLQWNVVKRRLTVKRGQPKPAGKAQFTTETSITMRRFPYTNGYNTALDTFILWSYPTGNDGEESHFELLGVRPNASQLATRYLFAQREKICGALAAWSLDVYRCRDDAALPPSFSELCARLQPNEPIIKHRMTDGKYSLEARDDGLSDSLRAKLAQKYGAHTQRIQVSEYGRIIGLYCYKLFFPCRPSSYDPTMPVITIDDLRKKPVQGLRATVKLLKELNLDGEAIDEKGLVAIYSTRTVAGRQQEGVCGVAVKAFFKDMESGEILASLGYYTPATTAADREEQEKESRLLKKLGRVNQLSELQVSAINDAVVRYRAVPDVAVDAAEAKERYEAIREQFEDESYELVKMAITPAEFERLASGDLSPEGLVRAVAKRIVVLPASRVLTDALCKVYRRPAIRRVEPPHYQGTKVVVFDSVESKFLSRLSWESQNLPFFHRPSVIVNPYNFTSGESECFV